MTAGIHPLLPFTGCLKWSARALGGIVHRAALMMIGAAVCGLSMAAPAKTTFVLPVAPGRPGNGPWTVEAWPDSGCTNCAINEADLAWVQGLVNDLLSAGQVNADDAELPVYVVRGGLEDGQTSVAKLKRDLAGCRVGSSGMLSPNDTTHVAAFGLRIDCEKAKRSIFMSVVMSGSHAPATLYLMPDGPIVATGAQ